MEFFFSYLQPGLVINHHADHTLSSFCQWQSGLMGKDGSRHDHAILLTGLDICSWKNEPCDTLGRSMLIAMLLSLNVCPCWKPFTKVILSALDIKYLQIRVGS